MLTNHAIQRNSILGFGLVLLLGLPAAAQATYFELSRLASQLYYASDYLATELRYDRHYGSVRLQAAQLSREARDLVNAISRNRSNSYIHSQFKDLSRRYASLEQAYLRSGSHGRDANAFVYREVARISDIYSSLNTEYHYGAFPQHSRSRVYPPHAIAPWPSGVARRDYRHNDRNRREADRRQHRNNRFDYGRRGVLRGNDFDHRSRVLERQRRQQTDRHRERHRDSRRTETRRRNHYQ